MGAELRTIMKHSRRTQRLQERELLPPDENKALLVLNREARSRNATLATGGKGGLPPTLVLAVMRRDEYTCKKCGQNQNLIVHHKGGLQNPVSRWLKAKAKSNDKNNIVTLCVSCHDNVHEEDRASDAD